MVNDPYIHHPRRETVDRGPSNVPREGFQLLLVNFGTQRVHPPPFVLSLTAQVKELRQRLQIAEAASASPGRMSPLRPPSGAESEDIDAPPSAEIVYVVDRGLELEVLRLREEVAERERIIEGLRGRSGVRATTNLLKSYFRCFVGSCTKLDMRRSLFRQIRR